MFALKCLEAPVTAAFSVQDLHFCFSPIGQPTLQNSAIMFMASAANGVIHCLLCAFLKLSWSLLILKRERFSLQRTPRRPEERLPRQHAWIYTHALCKLCNAGASWLWAKVSPRPVPKYRVTKRSPSSPRTTATRAGEVKPWSLKWE